MTLSVRNLALVACLAGPAAAQAPAGDAPHLIEGTTRASNKLSLEVGQDRLLELSFPLRGMSIPNPEIADVKLLSSNTQILVSAKGVGDTYITLLDKAQVPLVLSVHVTRNLDSLRKQIKELFPDEAGITVTSAGDLVVLSGEVSDLRVPERIAEVAKLQSPKVANLLHVRGNQQVQLEVKFAEVTRAGLREIGMNWFHNNGDRVGSFVSPNTPPGQFLDQTLAHVPGAGAPGVPTVYNSSYSDAFSLIFSGFGRFPFSVIVSLLEQNQLAKILAEPTLVAMTGQEAQFLSGGEIPIPVATTLGSLSLLWKKFGIVLKFLPTVLSDGLINLHLESEVSEPDKTLGVPVGNAIIPGFVAKKSETTVRLRDGQSFAIAGLLSDKTRSVVSKVPLLGEIPILGALFRSTSYKREESELLVVITARLAHPVSAHDAPFMPGYDERNDPNDFELFLLGKNSSKSSIQQPGQAIPVRLEERRPGAGGPTGEIGYMR